MAQETEYDGPVVVDQQIHGDIVVTWWSDQTVTNDMIVRTEGPEGEIWESIVPL